MRRTVSVIVMAALAAVIVLIPTAADARQLPADWRLHPCGSPTRANPPADVDRALRTSAEEFGVSYALLRSIARSESAFNPRERTGSHYGLFQHASRYWPARVRGFNRMRPENPVARDITDIWGNTRVSAWMIRTGGTRPWRC